MFIYNADVYCDDCGLSIIRRLVWENPELLEYDGFPVDSDDWPQRIATPKATDTPQHCGAGSDCLNAFTLPGWHTPIGAALGNELTEYGRDYVRELHIMGPTPVTKFWIEYYGVEV